MAKKQMVILDTDILIEIIRKNVTVIAKCDKIGTINLAITSISFNEFLVGSRNKKEAATNMKFLKKFYLIRYNQNIDRIFTGIYENYSLSHRPGIPDMLIASAALYYNFPVYTNNKKHFRFIRGIHLI